MDRSRGRHSTELELTVHQASLLEVRPAGAAHGRRGLWTTPIAALHRGEMEAALTA
jgi:hypothetical protein